MDEPYDSGQEPLKPLFCLLKKQVDQAGDGFRITGQALVRGEAETEGARQDETFGEGAAQRLADQWRGVAEVPPHFRRLHGAEIIQRLRTAQAALRHGSMRDRLAPAGAIAEHLSL